MTDPRFAACIHELLLGVEPSADVVYKTAYKETLADISRKKPEASFSAVPKMDSSSSVITVKAFLYRKWGEDPIEIRRFPLDTAQPIEYKGFVTKVASVFPQLSEENLKLHWIGELVRVSMVPRLGVSWSTCSCGDVVGVSW